ncbi:hypothetical protein PKCBPO_03948 [Methylorubrum thiocyanatum]
MSLKSAQVSSIKYLLKAPILDHKVAPDVPKNAI